jgi:signal transduction histidine kinase
VVSWPGTTGEAAPVPVSGGDLPDLPGEEHAFPVRDAGELLGALAFTKRPGDPLTPAESKLLGDLASQAGLVLRNVGLAAELRANVEQISRHAAELRRSRQRLVAAQDAERRRLERNIHDGAQQHLVALAVKLGLAKTLARRDPERASELVSELRAETTRAVETLRDLARGIYPTILTERGLVEALRDQAARSVVPVTMEAGDLVRYPAEVEAAVYFAALEAMQNVAKYSHASRAMVCVTASDSHLVFTVTDDGDGFDPRAVRLGTGMQGMADRLAAVGGELAIESAPGAGTTVTGRVPARPIDEISTAPSTRRPGVAEREPAR